MTNIQIEKAKTNDVARLQEISIATFKEAFAEVNTEEDMAKYLSECLSIEQLSKELNDNNAAFFFATIDDVTIGYLKLNFGASQTEFQDEDAIEIERIYVLTAYLGKRVGHLLCEKAIEVARLRNASYVWLGVWENNDRAIRFYKKKGFDAFGSHLFMLGNDEQKDILMKLKLKD